MPAYEWGTSAYYNAGIDAGLGDSLMADRIATIRRYEPLGETAAPATQVVTLSCFTADKAMSITQAVGAAVYTGGTAAATVTSVFFGLYEQTGTDTFTQRAVTPNDATLLTATQTRYFKAFTTPWALQPGRRYAVATLVVATTVPTFLGTPVIGTSGTDLGLIHAIAPVRARSKAGQASLTATITSTAVSSVRVYAEIAAA